jgi:hypothetical protein
VRVGIYEQRRPNRNDGILEPVERGVAMLLDLLRSRERAMKTSKWN